MVLTKRWIEVDRKILKVSQHGQPTAILKQATDAAKVLVVLEHQPLGCVPVQRVVRSTLLDQLVKPAEEIELSIALNES
ncbi:hypothetical protein RN02_03600 [Pseudomonas sp. PI1]|nr:hypothetical protein RN02_03600 [Pseudomonas sp. PI1]